MKPTTTLTIKHLDPETKKQLKAHCALKGITIEKQITQLIHALLKQDSQKKH